eukprot:gene8926-biopygen16679
MVVTDSGYVVPQAPHLCASYLSAAPVNTTDAGDRGNNGAGCSCSSGSVRIKLLPNSGESGVRRNTLGASRAAPGVRERVRAGRGAGVGGADRGGLLRGPPWEGSPPPPWRERLLWIPSSTVEECARGGVLRLCVDRAVPCICGAALDWWPGRIAGRYPSSSPPAAAAARPSPPAGTVSGGGGAPLEESEGAPLEESQWEGGSPPPGGVGGSGRGPCVRL